MIELAVAEPVGQVLVVVALGGLRLDSQGVLLGVVEEAAPRGGVLREDDRPLLAVGEEVPAVGGGRPRLPLHLDGVVGGEHRVLVGAAPPGALVAAGAESEAGHAVGDEAAPALPPPG